MITQELLCSSVLSKYENRQRKLLTQTSEEGMEGAPLTRLGKGTIYFFKLVITINQKNVSKKKKNVSRL